MNIQETGLLLAKIALIENRSATNEMILAWTELLHDVDYEDARDALIRHYRHSTDAVKPAHIIRGAKEIRAEKKKRIFE